MLLRLLPLPLVASLLVVTASAPAAAAPTTVLFDAIGQAGWRTSFDALDRNAPGFQVVSGGGQIFLGVSWSGVGPAIGGRARGGVVRGLTFVEAGGDLALQIQLGDRVRLRLGAEGGAAFLGPATAWYVGAFVDSTFDVVQLGGGRAAVVFDLRFDLDNYLIAAGPFPGVSTELGAGFGVRY